MHKYDIEVWRRWANLILCYGFWAVTIGLSIWVSFWEIPHTERWTTFAIILSLGAAITATLIRMRYKLTDTIIGVFYAGVRTGREAERQRRQDR